MTDQEGAIAGRISDRPVADLFQWLHETRRSGVARFRTALGTATVWFRDGELVDADMGRFHQDAAVLRLMRIQDGEYEVETKPVNQRRMIKQSTALLLAEGRQRAPRPGRPTAAEEPAASLRSTSAASVMERQPSGATVTSGSGEYSMVRDDSRPRRTDVAEDAAAASSSGLRRGPRSVDTGAHTLLNAKPPPRPPGRPPVEGGHGTDASVTARRAPVGGSGGAASARSPQAFEPERAAELEAASSKDAPVRTPSAASVVERAGPARGPAARRRGLGWSPTSGGPGQAPEPTPSARSAAIVPARPATEPPRAAPPADPADEGPRSGRTRFMFGVSGPGAEREPSDPPSLRSDSRPPARTTEAFAPASRAEPGRTTEAFSPAPRAEPGRTTETFSPVPRAEPGRTTETFAPVRPEPSAPATPSAPRFGATAPGPPAGAVATPVPPEDSVRSPSEGRRRRARAVARPQTPFEPERADRTILRAGPLPPPPGQPVVVPSASSQSIPITVGVTPSQSIPVGLVPSHSTPGGLAPSHSTPGAPSPSASFSGSARPVPYETPASHTTAIMGSDVAPPRPVATPMPYPIAAPVLIDEEYSHPISVPSVPPMTGAGPNGTWMLSPPQPAGAEKPLPFDPSAEETLSMRAPELPPLREALSSSPPKAGGGTAHVGRYEVLLRLARGGMGTVYLCRVTGEGGFRRLFALKVIRDHLNTNQAYVQMLLEEARIASRLSHPNIVSIIDIDTFAGQHYLVMDYVEGCTLSELLKAHPKARPPELVVPIVLDALTGLHAAHSMRGDDGRPQPVVHCDFSPQNMLVGVNGTCRLTDFGVAKAADALPNGPGRGKPGYLSPEQVRGLPLDPRSDIFSAGVVLWNALTGETLFDGDDPQVVLHQVVSRKIPRPSSVGLRPPACFDRICLRALERDPDRRYQTAEQMLMDLRKVAIAEDLLAASSEVGHWVQETFGAQIELRRQAAGLQPNPVVAALALRDLAAVGAAVGASLGGPLGAAGPSGHSEGLARDGSVTGHDPDASMTMMLRGGALREELYEDREGVGARARVVVIVAALAFIAAGVVTLFVRPDLLQGGVLDERGQYIDLSDIPDRERITGTGGEPPPGDDTTGTPVVAGASDSGDTDGGTGPASGGREPDTDGTGTGTGTGGEPELPADDGKATKGKGKVRGKAPADAGSDAPPADDGQAPADGDGKAPPTDDGKATKGKGKGKGKGKVPADDGSDAPPPDLNELFRPPGG